MMNWLRNMKKNIELLEFNNKHITHIKKWEYLN